MPGLERRMSASSSFPNMLTGVTVALPGDLLRGVTEPAEGRGRRDRRGTTERGETEEDGRGIEDGGQRDEGGHRQGRTEGRIQEGGQDGRDRGQEGDREGRE